MERLTGADALMLHLEAPTIPLHTLKIAVLDTSRRPGAVTLAELRTAVAPYLGLVARATQRVHVPVGAAGRPYWVDDPDFDLGAHLDEVTVTDGSRRGLDEVCARLAEQHLDRSRPLWSMTLVHGLDGSQHGGRQAVVVRVHHAVSDGLAALNTFVAATADEQGSVAPTAPATPPATLTRAERRRLRLDDTVTATRGLSDLVRSGMRSTRASSGFLDRHLVPGGLAGERSTFNAPGGGDRVCASAELDFAQLRAIGKATGATVNGVLHAVLAGAMRAEYADRGDRLNVPAVATFGVVEDAGSSRRWGNAVAPASVFLHVDVADPLERLLATARSCLLGVDLRRQRGFEFSSRVFDYVPRLAPAMRAVLAPHVPKVVNNITTANVAGPRSARWCGDVAVVDWISYAVAIAPADVNLTAYSYAGRLSIGLVATPEAMPDPAAFLARLQPELDRLRTAVHDYQDREVTHA